MKHGLRPLLVVAVLGLLAAALGAQVPDNARYVGSRMCITCHRATDREVTTKYVEGRMANALIEVNMDNEEQVDKYLVCDFTDAPFTRDDIAWILATGENEQAYMDADFQVLPAKWIVAENRWQEIPAVDGFTECVPCHSTDFNTEERTFRVAGVGCESCHGPGSVHQTAAPANKLTTILQPNTLDAHTSSMVCGQCHSKGRSTDGTSPFPIGYKPGANLDDFMVQEEVTGPGQNQQYTDLVGTQHWENEVGCLTCHDPHGDTGNPAQLHQPINDTCLSCHADTVTDIPTHAAEHNVEAAADATCATCHMPEGRHLFDSAVAAETAG